VCSFKSNEMKRKKLIKILQTYVGMQPKDVGCNNWNEMQQQLADDILTAFEEPELSDDVEEVIAAELENRMNKVETFTPAFEEGVKCHFFWFRVSQ